MTHTTTQKMWIKAIICDVLFTGGFALAALYGSADVHYWATAVIGIMVSVFFLVSTPVGLLTLLSWSKTSDSDLDREFAKSIDSFYTPNSLDRFAMSKAFEHYHVITESLLITLFIFTGHWILAILRFITLISHAVIMIEARARKQDLYTSLEL